MNAKAVLEALFFYMDGKTGRCDPSLDTIAEKCLLSRRTVVRALHALREQNIIDWVRRTVKTGNRKGEGPQRYQTSNAYFIDMVNLPVEIVRTLRQKLGDKLRETARVLSGSGKVPNRKAITVERLVRGLTGKFADTGRGERAERRSLASADAATRHARMYADDTAALREHEEMLGLSFGPSASAKVALYPPVQNFK